jgi:hypothetical protein
METLERRLKVVVVVPSIRDAQIRRFLETWQTELAAAKIIVVEDNESPTFDLSRFVNVAHFAWDDIDRDLQEKSWIIPRRTDCIRSYGFYRAYLDSPDMIISLDDDCAPDPGHPNFLSVHWSRLHDHGTVSAWQPTGVGVMTRGMPYCSRLRRWPTILNHGLWSGVPDIDSPTQLVSVRSSEAFEPRDQTIPVGQYYPMSGMNIAFHRTATPALYFC